ncbi:MAG TPA: hypothetical protein VJ813_15620 [Vicinamibacterales bacterium]|nr:hypothetical protein [Vicinamibacterales bacterium]
MPTPGARVWQGLALLCCALFLLSIAQLYDPASGFTTLIGLCENGHAWETPALQATTHYDHPGTQCYDGSYYVQFALDPLVRDPAIDRAMDNPAYRARRILFSWTAYVAGLGRPAWIVQAYAAQNIVFWLVLAWVMTHWLRPVNARSFAVWFAVMFSPGLLASVRLSLLDGPSMLLLALAVAAAEGGRTWTSAAVLGVAGLGRETNLLGVVSLPLPSGWKGWARLAGAGLVVILPLLVWQDYIWAIYRGTSAAAGTDHITPPLLAYARKWEASIQAIQQIGLWTYAGTTLLVVVALTAQAAYLTWNRAWREPWWRLAAAYAVLMFVVDFVVWEGHPGAVTRVVLPLTFGFNALLSRYPRGFWGWYAVGNLQLAAGVSGLPALF